MRPFMFMTALQGILVAASVIPKPGAELVSRKTALRDDSSIYDSKGFKKRDDNNVDVSEAFKKRGESKVDVSEAFKRRGDNKVIDVSEAF